MEYKKIFSYTKKILKLSFLSFILSISFSNKGVFAAPEYNKALPVDSSMTKSEGIALDYLYQADADADDRNAQGAYYLLNSDGTATAVVTQTGAYVFSKILADDAQSESESEAPKEFKVKKIVMGDAPPLNFSIFVLDQNDEITIQPPMGEKNSILTLYLQSGVKPEKVFGDVTEYDKTVKPTDVTKNSVRFDRYSVSVKSVSPTSQTTESDSESLSSDDEAASSKSSSSSSGSSSSSTSSGSSYSSSNYSSSNYNSGSSSGSSSSSSSTKSSSSGSSSASKSSSSGSSSASKSASTKTFGSSFNPLFLLSGICIPLFKKKKN